MARIKISSPSSRDFIARLALSISNSMASLNRELTQANCDLSQVESSISLSEYAFQNIRNETGLVPIVPPAPVIQVTPSGDSNIVFTEKIHELSEAIRTFWTHQGFPSVEDIVFDPHGAARVLFSFSLDEAEENASSLREILMDKGFQFIESDGEATTRLLDCDENRRLTLLAVRSRFPTATILSWKSTGLFQSDLSYMDTISVSIDFAEL